ncbi:MmgE/PrpD family protein [Limnohabitans sp. Rim8]|uniref:MmgE/PrpD family protein n=1 Tax=Limnohabitans sp. Rim8 TaxID=1100718 RepID=UPI002625F5C2|nr:MmgE/PrpD family protein [Limnohabitans sp. Rim8]
MSAVLRPAPEPVAPAISQQLAEFAAALCIADVPQAVVSRAKYLMLDAIGCAYAAREEAFATRIAASVARLAGAGSRGVIGMPLQLPMRDAAVINGMLMHGLDYDDTHAAGVTHLTVSTLPAALASAAQFGSSGAQMLIAYIAGVEAGARLACVVKGAFHQVGFHPTGLIGTFASALVAGRLMRLTPAQLAGAQGIALSFASGNLQFIEDGSWTKRIHPGWAAASGITAATLAADDFPAPSEAYEGRFGLYRSHLPPAEFAASDLSLATANLGSVWELDNVAIKPFPACHFVHGCADAAIALHEAGIDTTRIRSIRALIPAGVVKSVAEPVSAKRRPKNDYDAKFSIPYAVASGLMRGKLGLAEMLPAAFVEPRILALMDKVNYEIDEASTFPVHYTGEVVVTLDDGRIMRHRVSVNRGNPEQPLSNAEIEAKYFDNCALNLPHAHALRVRDMVLNLESVTSAAQFEAALASN